MKITGKQLRQIIKEELARNAMNEFDSFKQSGGPESIETNRFSNTEYELARGSRAAARVVADLERDGILPTGSSATQVDLSLPSTTAQRIASLIGSRLLIDNPAAASIAERPTIQSQLEVIAGGRGTIKMSGKSSPIVSVIKAAMQSALDELHGMLKTRGATTSAAGSTAGVKGIITKILLDDPVDASMLKYACAAAMSNLGMGSSGGVPSMNFDEQTSEAVMLIQHLAGLKTDGVVGKDVMDAIAKPRITIDV